MTREERDKLKTRRMVNPLGEPEVEAITLIPPERCEAEIAWLMFWNEWGKRAEEAYKAFIASFDAILFYKRGQRYIGILAEGMAQRARELNGKAPPIPRRTKPRKGRRLWAQAVTIYLRRLWENNRPPSFVMRLKLPRDFVAWTVDETECALEALGLPNVLKDFYRKNWNEAKLPQRITWRTATFQNEIDELLRFLHTTTPGNVFVERIIDWFHPSQFGGDVDAALGAAFTTFQCIRNALLFESQKDVQDLT